MCIAEFWSDRVEATRSLAASLAKCLPAGSLVLLDGCMGAGKTTFTHGFLAGLGHPDPREVASPTFALHHRYEGGRLPLNHLDLFRIEDASSMLRQGVVEALDDSAALTVVEWPDVLGQLEGRKHVRVALTPVGADGRLVRFTFDPGGWHGLLEGLLEAPRA